MKEEFCIFFDVLGTSAKFKGTEGEEEIKLLDKYENLIKIIKYEAKKINVPNSKIKYFSDNIFVSTSRKNLKELNDLLDFISICQIRSITECDLSMRGAIVLNTIRNNNNILMGKGLIEAHKEEGKHTIYPWLKFNEKAIKRYDILLDEARKEKAKKQSKASVETIKKVKTELSKEYNWNLFKILKIGKGAFLNYLNIIKDNKNVLDILEKHRNFILKNLKYDLKKINKENIDFLKLKDDFIIMKFKYFAYNMLLKAEERTERREENIVNIKEMLNKIRVDIKEQKKQINQFSITSETKNIIQDILKIREKYLFLEFYHNNVITYLHLEKKLNNKDKYIIDKLEIYE